MNGAGYLDPVASRFKRVIIITRKTTYDSGATFLELILRGKLVPLDKKNHRLTYASQEGVAVCVETKEFGLNGLVV